MGLPPRSEGDAMAGKKIGVIGDGNVGSALARGLKRAGHDVRTVGNDKAKIRETAGWAETVILAVPFKAVDDAGAKATVLQLARDIGFDAIDCGPLKNARYLEPLAVLNIQLGYAVKMGTDIGFKLVHAK